MGGIVPGHSQREIDQAKGILTDAHDEVLSGIERLVELVELGLVDKPVGAAHDALVSLVYRSKAEAVHEAKDRRAAA